MSHLAFDLDDTVLDLTGGLRSVIKKEYGVVLPEFEQWDLNPILEPILGMKWMKWMRRRDWLWATFPAVEGAIGSLDLLRQKGHFLECVTSKPEWAEAQVWKWLGLWRPPFNRVTIVGPKDEKHAATDADLLVDDKIDNLLGFVETGRMGILFERPHNRNLPPYKGITRAADWERVRKLIA